MKPVEAAKHNLTCASDTITDAQGSKGQFN